MTVYLRKIIMKFELVHTNKSQRFYKSDEEILVFPNGRFNWEEEIKRSSERLVPGAKMLDEKCFHICISDAHTHIERLVFAAGRFDSEKNGLTYGPYSMLHVGGYLTFLSHGGDPSSVKDDQVYLRQISILNTKAKADGK